LLLQHFADRLLSHLTSEAIGTGVLFPGERGWGVKFNTLFHVVPRLRRSGAILLIPLYTFMAWREKTNFAG